MKKLVLALIFPMCLTACANSENRDVAPNRQAQVESQATAAGVFITYSGNDMHIQTDGIGNTDAELTAAMNALKDYYNVIPAIQSVSYRASEHQKQVAYTVGLLQSRRTELLAKLTSCTPATK